MTSPIYRQEAGCRVPPARHRPPGPARRYGPSGRPGVNSLPLVCGMAAALLWAGQATWAAPDARGGVPIAAIEDRADSWTEDMLLLLQILYAIIGGDPEALSESPAQAMAQVSAWYDAHGLPVDLTRDERWQLGNVIDDSQVMLANTPIGLDGPHIDAFEQVLLKMESELAGIPQATVR